MSLTTRQQQHAATLFLLASLAAGTNPAHAAKDSASKQPAAATLGVDALHARARAGDAQAQYALAERYSNGHDVPMDRTLAFRWYGAAAAQGLAKAEYALARYHNGQVGDRLDPPQALALTTRAAEHGHVPAQTELGFLYFNGSGSAARNLPLSFRWFKQAAGNGSIPAQCMMGDFYMQGLGGVKQDYASALKWYKRTAVKDDRCASKSQFALHRLYASGKGVAKDMDTATRWLKKAAEAGNPAAQQALGRAYQAGDGLPQDPGLARRWMRKSREGVAPHDDHEHQDEDDH